MFRRYFSLVELLVVVGLLGVNTALLLPSLEVASSRAEKTSCAFNQRQMGHILQAYRTDNLSLPNIKGLYRDEGWEDESRWNWKSGGLDCDYGRSRRTSAGIMLTLRDAGYMPDSRILSCPGFPTEPDIEHDAVEIDGSAGSDSLTIGYNIDFMAMDIDNAPYSLHPMRAIYSDTVEGGRRFGDPTRWDRNHSSGQNVLFLDGHVRFVEPHTINIHGTGGNAYPSPEGTDGTVETIGNPYITLDEPPKVDGDGPDPYPSDVSIHGLTSALPGQTRSGGTWEYYAGRDNWHWDAWVNYHVDTDPYFNTHGLARGIWAQ